MNKHFLHTVSLSAFILIGLSGSKGICDWDPCQQTVYDDCIDKEFRVATQEEQKECMTLVNTLPREQCPNFFKCEKDCNAPSGCPPAKWQCSRAHAGQSIVCSQNCFKQYKVPRPSWYAH